MAAEASKKTGKERGEAGACSFGEGEDGYGLCDRGGERDCRLSLSSIRRSTGAMVEKHKKGKHLA